MIADSGGIDPAIAGGEHYVQLYQEVLKNEAVMRENFKKDGQDQEWIDTYFLSNKDGLTINQAFVDAVKCRAAQKPASSPTPSSHRDGRPDSARAGRLRPEIGQNPASRGQGLCSAVWELLLSSINPCDKLSISGEKENFA